MNVRERLFLLLQEVKEKCSLHVLPSDTASMVESSYLAENHVVPFPCAPGDTIYDIYEFVHDTPFPNPYMYKWEVKCIGWQKDKNGKPFYNIDGRVIPPDDFGKSIFLSEEEALVAIERGGKSA